MEPGLRKAPGESVQILSARGFAPLLAVRGRGIISSSEQELVRAFRAAGGVLVPLNDRMRRDRELPPTRSFGTGTALIDGKRDLPVPTDTKFNQPGTPPGGET